MKKIILRALYGALLVGGLTFLGATAADAADTTGEDGLMSGSQVVATVAAPIDAVANAVSVVGDSDASAPTVDDVAEPATTVAEEPAPVEPVAEPGAETSGEDGVASGTQVVPDVAVPVTVAGNAISVLGDSSSGGSVAGDSESAGTTASGAPTTSGSDGVVSGTQVVPDVAVPVTVAGNAISVLGDSSSGSAAGQTDGSGEGAAAVAPETSGEDGIVSGTQVAPAITVPITVSGNAISVIGDTATEEPTVGTGVDTGNDGTPTDPSNPGVQPGSVLPGSSGTSGGVAGGVTLTGTGTLAPAALAVEALASTGPVDGASSLLLSLAALIAGAVLLAVRSRTLHAVA
jgi:hypothetical protein